MDALSGLLSLYPMKASVERYGVLVPSWAIEKDAARHGSVVFHLVLDGEAELSTNKQLGIALKPGDIVVFPKGTSHVLSSRTSEQLNCRYGDKTPTSGSGLHSAGSAKLVCGSWEFEPDHTNLLLSSLPEQIIIRAADKQNTVSLGPLTSMIRHAIDSDDLGSQSFFVQLLSALFTVVMRAWLEDARSGGGLFAVLSDERLQPAVQGMFAAPAKTWSVEDLAEACSMSRATFARIFRDVSATTPAALLTQVRMAHATVRLLKGQLVSEVCEAVGYQSEAAFNRIFKKSYGIAPGQYRRSLPRQSSPPESAFNSAEQ